MPTNQTLNVQVTDEGLNVSGSMIVANQEWEAQPLTNDQILLKKSDPKLGRIGDSFAYCRLDVLISTLYGFVKRHFSGVVTINNGEHEKKLFFKDGRLVFASSNLIDDRLGEVIYRAGMITLEQMTEAAVQVNRTTKFGKVLINNGQFTSADLWEALKLQVHSIFQSIFYNENVYYQIEYETISASTMVIFEEPMESLIEESASFGQMFRAFLSRLKHDSEVIILASHEGGTEPREGTFLGDTIELIRQSSSLKDITNMSKLTNANTCVALFDLLNCRIIEMKNLKDNLALSTEASAEIRELKSLIDAYHVLLNAAKKAFESEQLSFPIDEIHIFLERKYRQRKSPVFLAQDGAIAQESVRNLFARGRNSRSQQEIMIGHIQSLIQFVLQVTGDLLPQKGWSIKKSFQEMLLT